MAEHDRIIAAAAKSKLGPLGFRRKGGSRLWFADRGYWVSIVEFQPSGFSKGSYLNIAAHWLWARDDHMSFDHLVDEARSFIPYENPAQFAPLVAEQVAAAFALSERLRAALPDLAGIARFIYKDGNRWHGGWLSYNYAIAAGVLNDPQAAHSCLDAIRHAAHPPDGSRLAAIEELEAVVDDPNALADLLHARIDANRARFGLPSLSAP